MPELPETETIARDLHREVSGARITGVRVTKPDVLREVSPRELARRTAGATIARSWRRAKLVVLDLSTGDHLVVQPRFTGALLIDSGSLPDREREYSTVEFALGDGRSIHYRDIRRLGTLSLMRADRFARYSAALGVEPLDPDFTAEHLSVLLRGSRQAIKKVLMDQRAVAGIGNIYANESLWRAGIDPSRAARRMRRAICAQRSSTCSMSRSTRAAPAFGITETRAAHAAALLKGSRCMDALVSRALAAARA